MATSSIIAGSSLALDAQIEACSDCRMRESCRGFARSYLQRFGVPKVTPIVDDRARRRLSLI
ncbi:MAG: hypothetical protein ACXVEE_27560, partial [Polyangiales bacterium]